MNAQKHVMIGKLLRYKRTNTAVIEKESTSTTACCVLVRIYMIIYDNDNRQDSACGGGPTWDVLGPADIDHQLPVCQVTQRGQSLDVAVGDSRVWHGIDLLRLSHQQV